MARKLIYKGDGQAVAGVPASDHTCEDDKLAAALVDSGLYRYASKDAAPTADDADAGDAPAERDGE